MSDAGFVTGTHASKSSAKTFHPSRLHRLREVCQVAAVCYRWRGDDPEFLLVQTRGSRWTFPKGGVEPGLTHAQAAALEAYEEAGVHGRIEEAAFARYLHHKRGGNGRSSKRKLMVHAHLCEVVRLRPPQEAGRNRTWFTAENAKRRLREDRAMEHGSAMARVVDRAVFRIQQLNSVPKPQPVAQPAVLSPTDGLQKVQFEAPLRQLEQQTSMMRYVRRRDSGGDGSAAVELAVSGYLREVFAGKLLRTRAKPGDSRQRQAPQLEEGTGPSAGAEKITVIGRS